MSILCETEELLAQDVNQLLKQTSENHDSADQKAHEQSLPGDFLQWRRINYRKYIYSTLHRMSTTVQVCHRPARRSVSVRKPNDGERNVGSAVWDAVVSSDDSLVILIGRAIKRNSWEKSQGRLSKRDTSAHGVSRSAAYIRTDMLIHKCRTGPPLRHYVAKQTSRKRLETGNHSTRDHLISVAYNHRTSGSDFWIIRIIHQVANGNRCAAPSPTPDEGDKDNLSEPKVTPKKAFSPTPAADLQVPHDRGEDNSPRSVTPKSTESEGQTSSMTEDDSSDKPNSPLRIKAIAEQGTSVRSNAPAVETKKGFVAFDIPLNDTQESSLDNLLKKPLPRRLRVMSFHTHLEPLGNAPQITSEMLMEKLEKAEEKRQKALARWKEQAAKRREMAIRRSEQMGDTIPLPQIQKTDDDADVDSVEGEKESDVNKSELSTLQANSKKHTCDMKKTTHKVAEISSTAHDWLRLLGAHLLIRASQRKNTFQPIRHAFDTPTGLTYRQQPNTNERKTYIGHRRESKGHLGTSHVLAVVTRKFRVVKGFATTAVDYFGHAFVSDGRQSSYDTSGRGTVEIFELETLHHSEVKVLVADIRRKASYRRPNPEMMAIFKLPATDFYYNVGWTSMSEVSENFYANRDYSDMEQLSYQTVSFFGVPSIPRPDGAKLMMAGYEEQAAVFCVITEVTSSSSVIGERCAEAL
ncbi:hypothetical protein CLF_106604 [Clonorchis sinensis]|uniref:Uncharacterized protein n=1 Tax=Clonorchis sinensis TaxID=79923 RepID=G7YQ32_CLOSI|nr:hypothetical protein CLF_106604 [Clonorchis sinensis]